jgi:hypothetical protein
LTIGVNLSRGEKFSRFLGGSKQLKPPYKQGGEAQNAKIVFTLSALVRRIHFAARKRSVFTGLNSYWFRLQGQSKFNSSGGMSS